jgi:SAM-dependent methyltransferase
MNVPQTTHSTCAICGNQEGNTFHTAREMMLGLRTNFEYLECTGCGCLQLANPPADLAAYYPSDYHSFSATRAPSDPLGRTKRSLRRLRNRVLLGNTTAGQILARFGEFPTLRSLAPLRFNKNSRILDVGCGSGVLLLELWDLGFRNLLGIDRFIPMDIAYHDSLRIRKGSLFDLGGTSWDVVMFHHSFEHIREQRETLETVSEILAPGGQCLIRVPLAAFPWKRYGVHWVELDAPRHFYLHTERSMRLLAASVGLNLISVRYEGSAFQFWGSELYEHDIPLRVLDGTNLLRYFTKRQIRAFNKVSRRLNSRRQGGRAAFYLKNPDPMVNRQAEGQRPVSTAVTSCTQTVRPDSGSSLPSRVV